MVASVKLHVGTHSLQLGYVFRDGPDFDPGGRTISIPGHGTTVLDSILSAAQRAEKSTQGTLCSRPDIRVMQVLRDNLRKVYTSFFAKLWVVSATSGYVLRM